MPALHCLFALPIRWLGSEQEICIKVVRYERKKKSAPEQSGWHGLLGGTLCDNGGRRPTGWPSRSAPKQGRSLRQSIGGTPVARV